MKSTQSFKKSNNLLRNHLICQEPNQSIKKPTNQIIQPIISRNQPIYQETNQSIMKQPIYQETIQSTKKQPKYEETNQFFM